MVPLPKQHVWSQIRKGERGGEKEGRVGERGREKREGRRGEKGGRKHSKETLKCANFKSSVYTIIGIPQVKMSCQGNLLLSRLTGAKMVVFPARTDRTRAQQVKEIHEKMEEYAAKLRSVHNNSQNTDRAFNFPQFPLPK